MSDSFSLTPADGLLSSANARLESLKSPSPSTSAASGQPAALDPRMLRSFESAADKYNVPVDVLLGMAHKDSGFDPFARTRGGGTRLRGIISLTDADIAGNAGRNPYVADDALDIAARKLRQRLDAGMSVPAALKAHGGNDEYVADVVARAKALADLFYPVQPVVQPEQGPPMPSKVDQLPVLDKFSDVERAVGRGALAMVNTPFEIASALGSEWAEGQAAPVRDYIDQSRKGDSAEGQAAQARLEAAGGRIGALQEKSAAKGIRGWAQTVIDNPGAAVRDVADVAGTVLSDPRLLANMAAESAPSMLGIGLFGKGAGALAGGSNAARAAGVMAGSGALSAGSIAQAVNEDVAKMPVEKLRELAPDIKNVNEARAAVRKKAFATWETLGAAVVAGSVDGIGPGVEKLIAGGFKSSGGMFKSALKSAGAEAGQEAVQSGLESAGTGTAKDTYQPEQNNYAGMIRDTVSGALVGGAMGAPTGAIAGARGRGVEPPPQQQPTAKEPATDITFAPRGDQSPAEIGQAGTPAAPLPDETDQAGDRWASAPAALDALTKMRDERALKGALTRAVEQGAPHVAPAIAPIGGRLVVTDEVGKMAGTVISQDGDGILFRSDSGETQEFSHEDIAKGAVQLQPESAAIENPPAPHAEGPDYGRRTEGGSIGEMASARVSMPGKRQEIDYSTMTEPQLRERLKYLAGQAKVTGWNKKLIGARSKIEAAIHAAQEKAASTRAPAAEVQSEKPATTGEVPTEGWKAFDPDTGTKGIPRAEMPQVETKDHGGLVRHLNAQGLDHVTTEVKAEALKPTQAEYSPEKVEAAKEATGDRAVIVSSDGHVIDGHHQVLAAQDKGEPVKAIVVNGDVNTVLDAVKASPAAQRSAEATADAKQAQVDPAAGKWFGSQEKAQAFLDKKNLAGSHEIQKTGRVRWEVKPKPDTEASSEAVDQMERPVAPENEYGHHKGQRVDVQSRTGDYQFSGTVDRVLKNGSVAVVQDGKSPHAAVIIENPQRVAPQAQAKTDATANKPSPMEGTWVATGRQDFKEGKPRVLPHYFTNPKTKNAKDWFRGWDAAKLESSSNPALASRPTTEPEAHPGLIIKSLQTGKVTHVAVGDRAQTGRRLIGKNSEGEELFEDERGVRSIVHDGVRIAEPVQTIPTRDGGTSIATNRTNRPQFQTAEEAKANEKPAPAPEPEKPAVSANTIFTEDAAAKAREFLKKRLNAAQFNSGIDPEVMVAGVTLAGYHIEKGARTFAAYAKAMLADLGDVARPYLKSWYLGAKFDPRSSALTGMSSAAEVEAADIDALEKVDEPAKLGQPSADALAGVPADALQGTEGGGQARGGVAGRGETDARGDVGTGSAGLPGTRGVGNGSRAVSVPAGREGAEGQEGPGAGRERSGADVQQAGTLEKPVGTERKVDLPASGLPADRQASDFAITEADAIGEGGAKTKARQNLAAIRTLKRLNETGAAATREDQTALAKFVGWGGLPQMFAREDGSFSKGWEKDAAALKELLTPDELNAAAASTRNAHYTSPEVVKAMWAAMGRLGFTGGRVLEPSLGVGNFFGLMPKGIRKASALHGVELDPITGGIAKHLYPAASVKVMGFQAFTAPDGYFDAVIGNPPFGSEKLYDPMRRDLSQFSIHNYFFAKSLDMLRPGGVMAMVVTNRFMDGAKDAARQYIADRADLVAAIRLPNDAFLKNAGTEVTTDILIFQKREEGAAARPAPWLDVNTFADRNGAKVPLNRYFIQNPDQMLGEFDAYGSMYRPDDPALVARDGQDTGKLMNEAVARLPQGIVTAVRSKVAVESIPVTVSVANVRIGSMFMQDGKVMERTEDSMGEARARPAEIEGERVLSRVIGLIGVRDHFADLRRLQLDPKADDARIEAARARLNATYDEFVTKNGLINSDANKRVFRDDPTWPQLAALEEGYDKGISAAVANRTGEKPRAQSAKKAAIFSRRTQSPYAPPASAATAKDALVASLSEVGRVDMPLMQRLYGKGETEILAELGDLVFDDPVAGLTTADAYLSGNVKKKLAEARAAFEQDRRFARNVRALEEVQPADVSAIDISVKPGAHWIPEKVMVAFAQHLSGSRRSRAFYNPATAQWTFTIEATNEAHTRWATDRASIKDILTAVSAQRALSIFDRVENNKQVLNVVATEAANAKAAAMRSEWDRWLFDDDARRESLSRLYNDQFNTDVDRAFDGSHLTFAGKVDDTIVALRPHQKNAIWRALQTSTTLLDHVVGAGKTYTMVGIAMEGRRMGLMRKPMLVVPNHLVQQWAVDFLKLYPGANVLAASKRDFEKDNRKKLFARIATGDWDAVIVAHSSFGRVEVDPEQQAKFIDEQVADLMATESLMREAEGKDGRNVKQVQERRKKLEEKQKKLLDTGRKDDSLYWDELGVDALLVDEGHEFKNLEFSTTMQRVAGLGSQKGSQKASDMLLKVSRVLDATNWRNVVFATGTPISNTMAEMFTLQRYLDPRMLAGQGLKHFDAWARMYGEVVTDWELSPAGKYKMSSRFAKFVNMPELMQRYRSFADVITRDDINRQLAERGEKLPIPKVKGGKPQNIVVDRSGYQAAYIGEPIKDADGNDTESYPRGSLIWRSENLPKGPPKKGDDNMLKIMSDARKAALDMRMIDPMTPDHPGSKVNEAARRIVDLYQAWEADKGTQLVFIDLSTPSGSRGKQLAELRALTEKADQGDEDAQEKLDAMTHDEIVALESSFSVYDDLKQKLIDRGIPQEEIAFIHDANTEIQKEDLFGKVRSGRVRVLLGSTAKMGAGMNVQERLVALHHLDAPWRPSDLEQREGRIIRQGNMLYGRDPDGFQVEINRYATKQTLDSRMWQTIEGKANFIEQIRKGGKDRVVEDVGGEAANAAEMKAASSGNPLILEEMSTRQAMKKLATEEAAHRSEQYRVRDAVRSARRIVEESERAIERISADLDKKAPEEFAITIRGTVFDKRTDAGKAVLAVMDEMAESKADTSAIGAYGDFKLSLVRSGANFRIVIKGASEHETTAFNDGADPVGIMQRIRMALPNKEEIEVLTGQIERSKATAERLEKEGGAWPKEAEYERLRTRHAELIAQLRPKKAATEEVKTPDDRKYSIGAPPTDIPNRAENLARGKAAMAALVSHREPETIPQWHAMHRHGLGWISFLYEAGPSGELGIRHLMEGRADVAKNAGYGNKPLSGKELIDFVKETIPAIIVDGRLGRWYQEGSRVSRNIYLAGRGTVVVRPVLSVDGGHVRVNFIATAFPGGAKEMPAVATPLSDQDAEKHIQKWIADAKSRGIRPYSLATQQRPSADGTPSTWEGPSATLAGSDLGRAGSGDGGNVAQAAASRNSAALLADLYAHPLGNLARKLIDAGRVTIVDAAPADAPAGTQGWTEPDGRITLVAGNLTPETANAVLLHEALHSGGQAVLGSRGWKVLMERIETAVNAAIRREEAGEPGDFWTAALDQARAAGVKPEHFVEEIAAYVVENHERAPVGMREVVERMTGRVKAWLLSIFGRQFGDVTPAQLRAIAIMALRSGATAPTTVTTNGIRYSIASDAPPVRDSLLEKARQRATDFVTAAMVGTNGSQDSVGRYGALALVPTRPLFKELAKGMSSAGFYIDTKQAMDALRDHWHGVTHETLQKWSAFARKNKGENERLMNLMHEATLAQIDPSKALVQGDDLAAYNDLKATFDGLSPTGKALFNEVRDAYSKMADEGEREVLANIKRALDRIIRDAEKKHADEMERIRDEGLSGTERDEAKAAADKALLTAQTRAKRGRAARMKQLRADFESNRMKGPYFPLARFGNYFVTVRDDAGKVISFSRFEKAGVARRFAEEMRGEPGVTVEEGVASAKSALERNLDPKFVSEIEALLGGANVPEAVRDQVWQRYLETLPDFSVRKRRIHRKGREGFNKDAMRAFASNMFHGSHQLARLKHGMELQEHLDDAHREARLAADPVRAQAVANEMTLRHDFVMNPTMAPWAHHLSSFTFVWTMGGNISSALVNLDQMITKGIPFLAYDEEIKPGMVKATSETLRALREHVDGRLSVERAKTLTADEKAAVRVGYDTGVIDRTQAHDVAGVAETGVEYNPTRDRIMRLLSLPMHLTEKANREVTFLASYRLARASGMTHEQGIKKASDLTWMTHFDNQSTSKPRAMQGSIGKVMFALKGFQANLLYRIARDFHQALHGEEPSARKAAFGRLASSIVLTAGAAGIKGTFLYSAVMSIIGAFMGDDDSPDEALRRWMISTMGDSMIGRAVSGMMLDGVPGYLTGTALSGRIGMADLWFRSNDREMTPDQQFQYWMEQLMGAPVGIAHQIHRGVTSVAGGNYVRGIEQMSPAFLRNAIRAGRYAVDGVENKGGDDIVENVPVQDVIKQAIGFTPAEIADRYARNTFQTNVQKRIAGERRDAMRAAVKARESGEGIDAASDKVQAYNERFPDDRIRPRGIKQAMRARERRDDRMEFGVDLKPGLAEYIKEKTAPSIYSR